MHPSPPASPRSPTTRSPTCTLPLHQFRGNVFYEHADGMARARGKALPWDKKLTLANSKFTACIFIFLIPAPSASNWGSTLLFPLYFSSPRLLYFFHFLQRSPPAMGRSGVSSSHQSIQAVTGACNPQPGPGHLFLSSPGSGCRCPPNSMPQRGDTSPRRETDPNLHSELRQLNKNQLDQDPWRREALVLPCCLLELLFFERKGEG